MPAGWTTGGDASRLDHGGGDMAAAAPEIAQLVPVRRPGPVASGRRVRVSDGQYHGSQPLQSP